MGLAAYGNPLRHAGAFQDLVQLTPSGFVVNGDLLQVSPI